MVRMKLGDIVRQVKIHKNPSESGLKYYVAGEHIETDNLKLKRGLIEGSTIGPAFTIYFKPGQVLLLSRRTYLRKMAVADFEGICSNVTYVLETKDENILSQEFLPFLLQDESFWEFAIKNQKGSTNPYVNWSDFAQYEFDLPSLEEQKKLANILWVAEKLKQKYMNLINRGETIKNRKIMSFIEENKRDSVPLSKIVQIANGLWVGKKEPLVKVKILRNTNFTKDCLLNLDNVEIYLVESKQFASRQLRYNDLIIEKSGGSINQPVGRAILFDISGNDYSFSNFTARLRLSDPDYLSKYVYIVLNAYYLRGDTKLMQSQTTGIFNLNMEKYLGQLIPSFTIDEQKKIIDIWERFAVNKYLLEKQIERINTLKAKLFMEVK